MFDDVVSTIDDAEAMLRSRRRRAKSSDLLRRALHSTRDPELLERVAEEALRRGVLADPSTTSYNIQPSLVMPPEELRHALRLVGEAVDAAAGDRSRGAPAQ